MEMEMNSDSVKPLPWETISLPEAGKINSKLAIFNDRTVHKIAYGLDHQGNYLLLYPLPNECRVNFNVNMRGISVARKRIGASSTVMVALLNKDEGVLFNSICQDLGLYMDRFPREKGPDAFVTRLQYLQNFLKKRADKLTQEEQQGLIGELIILRDELLKHYSPCAAVSMWSGIEDLPQDFACSDFLLEVKSILTPHSNTVTISSPAQLDGKERNLYLAVVCLDTSAPEIPGSFSLCSLIHELQRMLSKMDFDAIDAFNLRINEKIPSCVLDCGLLENEYDTYYYQVTDIIYYDTKPEFPKILPTDLPEAITKFKYVINLNKCSDYVVQEDAVFNRR